MDHQRCIYRAGSFGHNNNSLIVTGKFSTDGASSKKNVHISNLFDSESKLFTFGVSGAKTIAISCKRIWKFRGRRAHDCVQQRRGLLCLRLCNQSREVIPVVLHAILLALHVICSHIMVQLCHRSSGYYKPLAKKLHFNIGFQVVPGRMSLLVMLLLVIINVGSGSTALIPTAEGLTALEVKKST